MPIMCYSTTIDAGKTVAEIQRLLTRAGAGAVMIQNEDRRPVAVAFEIESAGGRRSYRLPARVDGVLAALRRSSGVSRSQRTPEHAERVAWRITLEWIKVQLAVIESGLVTLDEVMLPYRLVGGGRTVYEAIQSGRLALPGPAGEG